MKLDLAKSGFRGAGARPWSAADHVLLQEARELGFGTRDIAALLDRSAGAVRGRLALLDERASDAAQERRVAARAKQRHCLRCLREFPSPHAGVRLCDPCRAGIAGVSPFHPEGLRADIDNVAASDADAVPLPPLSGGGQTVTYGAAVTARLQPPRAGNPGHGGSQKSPPIGVRQPHRAPARNAALS